MRLFRVQQQLCSYVYWFLAPRAALMRRLPLSVSTTLPLGFV
jgi:hypothetical protein